MDPIAIHVDHISPSTQKPPKVCSLTWDKIEFLPRPKRPLGSIISYYSSSWPNPLSGPWNPCSFLGTLLLFSLLWGFACSLHSPSNTLPHETRASLLIIFQSFPKGHHVGRPSLTTPFRTSATTPLPSTLHYTHTHTHTRLPGTAFPLSCLIFLHSTHHLLTHSIMYFICLTPLVECLLQKSKDFYFFHSLQCPQSLEHTWNLQMFDKHLLSKHDW